MELEILCERIIEAAIEVHRQLGGPGLLEAIYEAALAHELSLRGIRSKRQVPIPILYKEAVVREPIFLDLLVEDTVIVELKATGKDYPLYQIQLATQLRLSGMQKGLLINFGKESLKDAVMHIHNDLILNCH